MVTNPFDKLSEHINFLEAIAKNYEYQGARLVEAYDRVGYDADVPFKQSAAQLREIAVILQSVKLALDISPKPCDNKA